jgi:hypothetical protein
MAKLGKQRDPNLSMGTPLAAGGYNTAAAHLKIDRHFLLKQMAPAQNKEAANLLPFRQYNYSA